MPDTSDMDLLREYSQYDSETAFAEVVQRHVNLVYSVAFRHVGMAAQAEEITQAVFIILARKSARFRRDTVLEGWLYETTRLTSLSFLRGERRRQFREQEAYMQSTLQQATDNSTWDQLAPFLDEAISRLSKKDRTAVVLRFFKQKNVREVAASLRVSEAAAQRRILRALEKLRKFFVKRGVSSAATVLAETISNNSVQAAPAALAKSVTAAALSGATTPTVMAVSKAIAISATQKLLVAAAIVGALGAAIYLQANFSSQKRQSNERSMTFNTASPYIPVPAHSPSNGITAPPADNGDSNLNEAIANLQKVLHTRPTTHQMYNYEKITNAIGAFGLYRMSAFRVLMDNSDDPQEFVRGGAIAGMGDLGKFLPDVAPVLWSMIYTSQNRDRWMVFNALKNIGFEPANLPALTDLMTNNSLCNGTFLTELVPESTSTVIMENPTACAPHLPALEALLTNSDSSTRFRAALALVRYEGTNNPNVFPAIHAVFASPNNRSSEYNKNSAAQILAKAGPIAKPFVPDLLQFAKSASEADVQDAMYSAIADIEPALASQIPRVAKALKQKQEKETWSEKFKSGAYSFDDLRAALIDPTVALESANRLAAMGTAAKVAVPDMIHALWGKDEDTRNKILADIYKIDPEAAITKIPASNIMTGNLHAFLDKQPPTEQHKRLIQDVYTIELFSGWVLPDELAAFTNKLARENPAAYQIFVNSNKRPRN